MGPPVDPNLTQFSVWTRLEVYRSDKNCYKSAKIQIAVKRCCYLWDQIQRWVFDLRIFQAASISKILLSIKPFTDFHVQHNDGVKSEVNILIFNSHIQFLSSGREHVFKSLLDYIPINQAVNIKICQVKIIDMCRNLHCEGFATVWLQFVCSYSRAACHSQIQGVVANIIRTLADGACDRNVGFGSVFKFQLLDDLCDKNSFMRKEIDRRLDCRRPHECVIVVRHLQAELSLFCTGKIKLACSIRIGI